MNLKIFITPERKLILSLKKTYEKLKHIIQTNKSIYYFQ
jgi:hypothetical protein